MLVSHYINKKMVSSSHSRANQRGREPTTEVTGADAQFVPAMATEVVGKSFVFYYPKVKEREDRCRPHPPSEI
jgi:hypothetical protein